jgi:hypothetical protein
MTDVVEKLPYLPGERQLFVVHSVGRNMKMKGAFTV